MKNDKNPPICDKPDENNNTLDIKPKEIFTANSFTRFVERLLFLIENQYLIVPNGGSGDCMFKAVCQAVHRGEELKHTEVRRRVVDFIVQERWDKFKESIEVQHVSGNRHLTKKWKSNPIKAYQTYMSSSGTLGSSSELTAAGELFGYNFATIQEYSSPDGKAYRFENCCHFDKPGIPFYHFFFTGDFDNGHWEFLEPVGRASRDQHIPDGVYNGLVTIMIDGVQNTVDNWLKVHTENTNDAFRLKYPSIRSPAMQCSFPFEWDEFKYNQNRFVPLKGNLYEITETNHTDLFSVLADVLFENPTEDTVNRLESKILSYRLENFANLNHKIITQPHSHGFSIVNFKYLSMPSKGNIQDLLSAADLFSFSFQIFIKSTEERDAEACKFIHIDRWGEEEEKIVTFFMRVFQPSGKHDEAFSKWWHLALVDDSPVSEESEDVAEEDRNVSQIGDGCSQIKEKDPEARPVTPVEHVKMVSQKLQATSSNLSPRNEFINSKTVVEKSLDNVPNSNPSPREQNRSTKDIPISEDGFLKSTEIGENKPSKASKDLNIDNEDPTTKNTSFIKMHDNLSGMPTIPISSQRIDNFPKIEINADPSVISGTANVLVPNIGIQAARKIKTIIEMFDEKSKQRKKYVYNGFVSKEKVLQTLYLQGLINDPLLYDTQVNNNSQVKNSKHSLISPTDKTTLKMTEKSVEILEDEKINKVEAEVTEKPYIPDEILTKKSASVIALIADESILRTNKFLEMHRRVAPLEKKPDKAGNSSEIKGNKGCFRRFLAWILLIFRNNK